MGYSAEVLKRARLQLESNNTEIQARAAMRLNQAYNQIPRLKEIFTVDSVSTAAGAMMGTSTVAVYVESAAGVNEGGRSGLTAFVTGCCFLLALLSG